ncbi:hypothetical protein CHUAL_012412 [Chamberlinius hualienensis]
MAVTSQSVVKSQNSDSNGLTFTKANKYLLCLHILFGINISHFVKWQLVSDILFAIHLLMSVMYIAFAYAKAEFDSDDNQIVFLSVAYTTMGILNLLMKLSHRRQCRNKTKLIKEIEEMLKRFNGKEAVQLKMLERWSWRLFLIPIIVVAVHLIFTTEKIIFGDNHLDFGTKKFQDLSEKYNIDYIYNYTMAPFNYAYELLFTLMMLPIHRDVRRLYRLTNTAFSTNVLLGLSTILLFTLSFARTVTVNWQAISWATVIGLIVFLTVLYAHIIFISTVNEKLRQSNSHLLRMSYHMGRRLATLYRINWIYTSLELIWTFHL